MDREILDFANELMRDRNWSEKTAMALAPILYKQGITCLKDFETVKQKD